MGPVAATLAVAALRPSAKSARPKLEPGTLARVQAASDAYADAQSDEALDELADLIDDEDLAHALGSVMQEAGIDLPGDVMGLLDEISRMQPIQPEVWLGVMQEHLGWRFADIDEDAEQDGDQVAVAVGTGRRRFPVFMSAAAYIPGDIRDENVARLKASIGAEHPAGAVLIFNRPTGWLHEHGPDGLVYGGLLWSDNAWSAFVLRPGSGLDDALTQRGRDIAHPDAHIMATLGFADVPHLLRSLAAQLAGFEPDEVDVQFLRLARGWLLPLVTPP